MREFLISTQLPAWAPSPMNAPSRIRAFGPIDADGPHSDSMIREAVTSQPSASCESLMTESWPMRQQGSDAGFTLDGNISFDQGAGANLGIGRYRNRIRIADADAFFHKFRSPPPEVVLFGGSERFEVIASERFGGIC